MRILQIFLKLKYQEIILPVIKEWKFILSSLLIFLLVTTSVTTLGVYQISLIRHGKELNIFAKLFGGFLIGTLTCLVICTFIFLIYGIYESIKKAGGIISSLKFIIESIVKNKIFLLTCFIFWFIGTVEIIYICKFVDPLFVIKPFTYPLLLSVGMFSGLVSFILSCFCRVGIVNFCGWIRDNWKEAIKIYEQEKNAK